ncbi:hypothetical protein TBR22_A30220 [Luteitalea sp. TBR-22]|nr:hypothetical protein TBR22_A30220 [Luteitalea sp. TBR-22]
MCVDWYHISSREGASGFFVVFTALLSGGAGTLVGLALARGVATIPGMTALKALGLATAVVLTVAGAVGSAARLLADVPPEIDGETLLLAIELQWPAGQPAPRAEAGAGEVRLGTLSGSTVRREEAGPLFLEDAHLVNGAWVVPGVAPIFTSRGTPVVNVTVAGAPLASVLPPLPRRPGQSDRQWSAWIAIPASAGRAGAAPSAYRFRVLRSSDPVRSQQAGPFTVETIARWFTRFRGEDLQVSGEYRVRRNGAPVPGAESLTWVALVSREPWTLLAAGDDGCRLLAAAASAAPMPCDASAPAWNLLALDRATTSEPRAQRQWLDTTTFRDPGVYVVGPMLLDTRTPALSPHGWPSEPMHEQDRPPLALSPDARTMAWFAPGNGYDTEPAIATLRLDTGATTVTPIDRTRMRYRTPELDITPAWFAHHFHWVRSEAGADVLDARPDAPLLPYRGALSEARDGGYQTYLLSPGGRPLRDAVVDILLTELGGVRRDPDASAADTPRIEVEGVVYEVSYSPGGDEVRLVTYATRAAAMARVAAHLDAIATSGRLDALFTKDTTPP